MTAIRYAGAVTTGPTPPTETWYELLLESTVQDKVELLEGSGYVLLQEAP